MGGWATEGRLNPLLGVFGLAMSPRSTSHRLFIGPTETSCYHWGEFQNYAFHLMPSMGPVVSVVNFQGHKNSSRQADQSVKPGNGTVNG